LSVFFHLSFAPGSIPIFEPDCICPQLLDLLYLLIQFGQDRDPGVEAVEEIEQLPLLCQVNRLVATFLELGLGLGQRALDKRHLVSLRLVAELPFLGGWLTLVIDFIKGQHRLEDCFLS